MQGHFSLKEQRCVGRGLRLMGQGQEGVRIDSVEISGTVFKVKL